MAAEEAAIKRKFGLIQSVWAERMNLEEGEFEAHELRMGEGPHGRFPV